VSPSEVFLFFLSSTVIASQTMSADISPSNGIPSGETRFKAQDDISLNSEWTMWIEQKEERNGVSEEDYLNSLKNTGIFKSLKGFVSRWEAISKPENGMGNVHIFKKGVKPIWEDDYNINGGKWVVTILKENQEEYQNAIKMWLSLVAAVLSEQLGYTDQICGAVLSLKQWGVSLQVWNRDAEDLDQQEQVKQQLIKVLKAKKVKYVKHRVSLQKNIKVMFPHVDGEKAKEGGAGQHDASPNGGKTGRNSPPNSSSYRHPSPSPMRSDYFGVKGPRYPDRRLSPADRRPSPTTRVSPPRDSDKDWNAQKDAKSQLSTDLKAPVKNPWVKTQIPDINQEKEEPIAAPAPPKNPWKPLPKPTLVLPVIGEENESPKITQSDVISKPSLPIQIPPSPPKNLRNIPPKQADRAVSGISTDVPQIVVAKTAEEIKSVWDSIKPLAELAPAPAPKVAKNAWAVPLIKKIDDAPQNAPDDIKSGEKEEVNGNVDNNNKSKKKDKKEKKEKRENKEKKEKEKEKEKAQKDEERVEKPVKNAWAKPLVAPATHDAALDDLDSTPVLQSSKITRRPPPSPSPSPNNTVVASASESVPPVVWDGKRVIEHANNPPPIAAAAPQKIVKNSPDQQHQQKPKIKPQKSQPVQSSAPLAATPEIEEPSKRDATDTWQVVREPKKGRARSSTLDSNGATPAPFAAQNLLQPQSQQKRSSSVQPRSITPTETKEVSSAKLGTSQLKPEVTEIKQFSALEIAEKPTSPQNPENVVSKAKKPKKQVETSPKLVVAPEIVESVRSVKSGQSTLQVAQTPTTKSIQQITIGSGVVLASIIVSYYLFM